MDGHPALRSIGADRGSCTQTAPITCALGILTPGTGAQITLRVRLTQAGPNQNSYRVSGAADDTDGNPNDDLGGVGFQVSEPEAPIVPTPAVDSGSVAQIAQAHLDVAIRLAPHGQGRWWIEDGTTLSYGKRTGIKDVSSTREATRKATLDGLKLRTRYHDRAVFQVGDRTYRGRDVSERTFGRILYPDITLKAKCRTPTGTSYTGVVGPIRIIDAPGACSGSITVEVSTLAGADLLRRTVKVAKDCTYAITVPFGSTQRARYGRRGSILVQARFAGTRFFAAADSSPDRP